MMKIKLQIVTDPSFVAEGFISSMENDDAFEFLATVNTRKALVNSLRQETPDLLVLDINMPLIDGIDTLLTLSKKYPAVKTVIVSEFRSPRLIAEIKNLGAKGYLLKSTPYPTFKKIILEIHGGLNWGEYLEREADQPKSYYMSDAFEAFHLTLREVEVIQLVGKHFSAAEIGDFLFLSEFATRSIMENIYLKLGIQNENELISFARENKIVD